MGPVLVVGGEVTDRTPGAPGVPITVGAVEIHVLVDGLDRVPPEIILAGESPDALARDLPGQVDADGQLAVAYDGLLIRIGGRLILVDAGSGEAAEADGAGTLLSNLLALGVDPAEIGDVVLSHGHADHIGGLTRSVAGRQIPIYANARHWFWSDEWAYWTDEGVLAAVAPQLSGAPRASLPSIAGAGLVTLVEQETEIADGVRVVPAAGHTPGHVALAIESGGERAMYLGDAVFHPLNFEHPDAACVFDVDRAGAAASRRRLLDLASRDGSLVFASHVTTPGRVERAGRAYRLVPEMPSHS